MLATISRACAAFVIGVAIGALSVGTGAAYFDRQHNQSTTDDLVEASGPVDGVNAGDPASNADMLGSIIAARTGSSQSGLSELELTSALSSLVEVDPDRALTLALSAEIDVSLLIALYRKAASIDAEVALALLESIRDATSRNAVSLALLDTMGHNVDIVDRIAAALPAGESFAFRVAAVQRLAGQSPDSAIAAALTLKERAQREAALRLFATVAARTDPLAGLAAIRQSDDWRLVQATTARLLGHWASIDPDGVFSYLESADPRQTPATREAFSALAIEDPQRLLSISARFRPDARMVAQEAALLSLIDRDRDPAAAYDYLDGLSPGSNRDSLRRSITATLAETNPELAWSWVTVQRSPSELEMIAALRGIRKVDHDRALDLLIETLEAQIDEGRPSLTTGGVEDYLWTVIFGDHSAPEVRKTLDRLVQVEDPRMDAALNGGQKLWAISDPEAMLSWVMDHPEEVVDIGTFAQLGRIIGAKNSELATRVITELPSDVRQPWVSGMVNGMAENDFEATRTWALSLTRGDASDAVIQELLLLQADKGVVDQSMFGRFSGDSAREEAVRAVAERLASDNPELARSTILTQINEPAARSEALSAIDNERSSSAASRGSR